jgi:hypothetical protein
VNQGFSFGDYGGYVPGISDLVATGSTQADALPLLREVNHLGTVPGSSGVKLPLVTSSVTTEIVIINRGQNDCWCYPPEGGQIEAQGMNQPYLITRASTGVLTCFGAVMVPGLQWWVRSLTQLPNFINRQDQFAQDMAPLSPMNGDIWWDSARAELFIWYDDGTSQQWVSVAKTGTSVAGGP